MAKPRKTEKKTPGNEAATAQRAGDRARPAEDAWRKLRKLYSVEVRERVDEVLATGGVSLELIQALEFAEHERLEDEIEEARDTTYGSPAIARFFALRLQSRKHLRTLRLAMTPLGSPADMAHPTPDIVAALAADGRDEDDLGDDLLS